MKRRSLSSITLQVDPQHEKATAKPRLNLRKLNIRAEKSTPLSERESISKQPSKHTTYSARHTPNQSILDLGKEPTKPQNFRFSTSQRASSVPKKPLPRLYTENLQKNVSEKVEQLKEKYGVLYKYMLKAHGINVEKEDLRDVIKKSKPIFNSTYSIKYFGITNSEFGIVSQRVPLQTIYQENNAAKSGANGPSNQFFNRSEKQNTRKGCGSTSLAGSTYNNLDDYVSLGKESPMPSGVIEDKDYIIEQKGPVLQKEASSPKLEKARKRVVVYPFPPEPAVNDEVQYQLVAANPKNPMRSATDLDDKRSDSNMLSELPRRKINENNFRRSAGDKMKQKSVEKPPEMRTITTYALPKKLEAFKKRQQSSRDLSARNARQVQERVSVELSHRDIPLMKTRNNGMVAELYPKEYIDELSIPEKFRTHEIKALMSSRANYSYSKLLTTLYSKEKPEDVLIENTRKIEEIRVKREEMKKAHLQRQIEKKVKGGEHKGNGSPQNRVPSDEADARLYALQGPFQIRIVEPTLNPMYEAFAKIRGKVENEIIE